MDDLAAMQLPLRGPGVIVRELRSCDVEALYEIESDAEVKRFLNGPVLVPCDTWVAGMQRDCPTETTLAVVSDDGGELLGRAALSRSVPFKPIVELEVVLGRATKGRHLGREVAAMLVSEAWRRNAKEVVAITHPRNDKALSLLRALNFRQSGVVAGRSWQTGFFSFSLAHDA